MTGAALRNSGGPVAIFAGRLEPFKGVFLALHTLVQLPDWRLVICGSGDDEQRMRTLARRLGIEPRVEWTGWLSQDEVLMRMTEADVLLFPCLHEEAGAVVVEARAAGLPIVCLDRGGPRLLIGPDGIRVSATGSVDAIAHRLAEASTTCLDARRTRAGNPRMESLTLAHRAQDLQALLIERLDLPSDTISAPPGG